MFANTSAGSGLGAKNPILSCCGSVLGATCKKAAKGEGGRWLDGADEVGVVVVVVGLCVHKH